MTTLPLISAREIDSLKNHLKHVQLGKMKVLCTKATVEHNVNSIHDTCKVIAENSYFMSYKTQRPVLTLGRFCNKKGSRVSGSMMQYIHSLYRYQHYNIDYLKYTNSFSKQYENILQLERSMAFCSSDDIPFHFFTCDAVPKKEYVTMVDAVSQRLYLHNTCMPLVDIYDKNVLSQLSQVQNPLGLLISPNDSYERICDTVALLNPAHEKGKIVFMFQYGLAHIDTLEIMLRKLRGLNASFMIDPMSGNLRTISGYSIRYCEDIHEELYAFDRLCAGYDLHNAGLCVSVTGENVSECLYADGDVPSNCRYTDDPSLNSKQLYDMLPEKLP